MQSLQELDQKVNLTNSIHFLVCFLFHHKLSILLNFFIIFSLHFRLKKQTDLRKSSKLQKCARLSFHGLAFFLFLLLEYFIVRRVNSFCQMNNSPKTDGLVSIITSKTAIINLVDNQGRQSLRLTVSPFIIYSLAELHST